MANDFLVFAGAPGANVLSQASYSALASRTAGFSAGIAKSMELNKVWRQSSIMSSVLAQFISNYTFQDSIDDGTTATLLGNLGFAVKAVVGQAGHGQCRLSVTGSTSIKLSQYDGTNLIISGIVCQIPTGGVFLSNSGLAANTTYYVYAHMGPGVMTLEASTTGHGTGTNGVEVKSTDVSRTLVGMIRTNGSAQFVDTTAQRFCINWFNRRALSCNRGFGANRSTSSSTPVEISSGERAEFLTWGDEALFASSPVAAMNNTGGQVIFTALYIGGVSAATQAIPGALNSSVFIAPQIVMNIAEGYSFLSVYGAAPAGFTTTWLLSSTVLTATIQG